MSELETLLATFTCGDDQRIEAAVAQIAAFGVPALEALEARLASSDVDTRWWAVRTVAAIPASRSVALLIRALQDRATEVRQCAALGLRLQPSPQAIPDLVVALSSPDSLLASLASDALAAVGAEAVPALVEVLETGPVPAKRHAARALARLGDPRAIPALFNALDSDSLLLEYWASEALDRCGAGMVFYRP